MSNSANFHLRRGQLQFPSILLETEPELIQRIYSMVIPVRVEHLYMEGVFDVYALSEFFDECEEGAIVPIYNVVYDTDTDEITFERVDSPIPPKNAI